jgi:hypothetical protein
MISARMIGTWPTKASSTSEQSAAATRLDRVVMTAEEFDRVVSQALPELLDRATNYTKRFLRETGQWSDDVAHEKFVLRWGAEYLERFLVCGRSEVPCRPLFLLDSLVAKQHSQPEPFCYHPDLLKPFGWLIDGLLARAAISRDALIALYHHCYGLGPGQVIALLGMTGPESQRIYKNFQRWRDSGWQRAMDDRGLTADEIAEFQRRQTHSRHRFNSEADRLVRFAQTHYRKSEPDHYPCLSKIEWQDMFAQGYGTEYRIWHLALCVDCLHTAWAIGNSRMAAIEQPQVDFRIHP